MLEDIPPIAGTYLLVFQSDKQVMVNVGRRGSLELVPGYYFYVGSAFGSGGLRARIRHHQGVSKKPHWHLDYIRPHLLLRELWYSTDNIKCEHAWSDRLYYTIKLQIPMPGLGSSDCKCESHFFYSEVYPDVFGIRGSLDNNNLEHIVVTN
ncbi:MAG: GIY-YIG nuclease family protein [Gammaproteobacteria bacterium]|nr:GIY-YIG nuclease family protein [Gammaproteobacteria bacterium]